MGLCGIVLALGLGLATAADAVDQEAPGEAFPDMGATYFHRANCHEAYDQVVDDMISGRDISNDDKVWAGLYEQAATDKQPCPEPGPALARRAVDRTVSTDEGLGHLALYQDQDEAATHFEAGLGARRPGRWMRSTAG